MSEPFRDSEYRTMLVKLLAMRKHYPYRLGLIQGFVCCGKITNEEFDKLQVQITAKVNEPKL